MSLIYDYLKIYGKGNSGKDSDVEIPPTLSRRESKRFTARYALFVFCSCLIGILCLFLVLKIVTSRKDIQTGVKPESVAKVAPRQVQPETATGVEEKVDVEKPVQQQDKMVARFPSAEPVSPGAPSFAERKKSMQVFPEPVKQEKVDGPAALKTASVSPELHVVTKKRVAQPPELVSSSKKITLREKVTAYIKPSKTATGKASAVPPGRYAAGPKTSGSVFSQPSPESQEKSRKLYQAGLQAHQAGDHRIADIYYNKALEELPGNMEAMINLSALYVQQERYAEAEDVLDDILALDPANSKALVNLGMISLSLNDEAQAAAQFKAALDSNPGEENALINLAYLAEKKRDFATTEMYYKQLLQISPDNLEVLLAYGHLLEEEKRFQDALSLYTYCLKLGPVMKDQQIYSRISQRMMLLNATLRNSQL
jgi:Tfp pilus assembly protein PilF